MLWDNLKFDTEKLEYMKKQVDAYTLVNPACSLIHYWKNRRNNEIEYLLVESNKLPEGYVGSGWPHPSDQKWAIQHDVIGINNIFNDPHYRDVGDLIYQTNTLLLHPKIKNKKHLNVMDFGSGYGRLALGMMTGTLKLGLTLNYLGVDYVPVSLIIAPQFIQQTFGPNNYKRAFYSVGAWELSKGVWEEIRGKEPIDIFTTIHSFQEMEQAACDFYVDFATKHSRPGSLFYSVNLSPPEYMTKDWRLLSDVKYPINRDGSFNEKIWERI